MNLVAQLRHHLVEAGIVSAEEERSLTITLAIGDAPRHPLRLTRRYIVSRPDGPGFSVKFIPQPWGFNFADIVKTQSQYTRCASFRVPQLIGHFPVREGCFFVEENLGPAPTLALLVEQGAVRAETAAAVIRTILGEIWESGRKPTESFVRQEKARYRTYLGRFIAAGLFADVTADRLDRIVDDHRSVLRRVWSSGDIIDKNIVRVADSWCLVDFEYSHETLFFFKEAYRSILNSPWARDLRLADVCPFLGEFPEAAARILSLAWERQLYSLVLDKHAEEATHTSLRDRFWQVFDVDLVARNDRRLTALQDEVQQLGNVLQTQREQLARRDADAEQFRTQEQTWAEESARLRHLATERVEHTRRLEAEISRQQIEHGNLQAHARNLEAELDRLHEAAARAYALEVEVSQVRADRENATTHARNLEAEISRQQIGLANLQAHARNLDADLDRLREAAARAHTLEAEVTQVRAERESATTHARNLEAEISRQLIHQGNLQAHAHNLEAEVARLRDVEARAGALAADLTQQREAYESLRTRTAGLEAEVTRVQDDAREAWSQVHAVEDIVEAQRVELERATTAAQALQETISKQDEARAQLAAETATLQNQIQCLQSELAARAAELECERQAVRDSARYVAEREQALATVLNSRSWHLTRPLRWGFDQLRRDTGPPPAPIAAATVSSPALSAPAIRYHVEAFRLEPGDQPEMNVVQLRGWCFAPSEPAPVVLELRAGERMRQRITCDLVRDDVAAAHAEDVATSPLPRCGFTATVAVERELTQFALLSPVHGTTLATLPDGPSLAAPTPGPPSVQAHRTLEYNVEKLRTVANPFHSSKFLEVSGWCFAPERSAPVRLELRADGERLLECSCDRARPDVAAGFHSVVAAATSSLPLCGFEEVFPLVGALPSRFELVSPHDGIVLAHGSAEQLATWEAATTGDAAFAAPIVTDWLDAGPTSFVDRLRRIHTRARASVTWRAALSPVTWQQWLRRTLEEYRLQRLEWQMAGAAGELNGDGARAPTTQPEAAVERAPLAGRPLKIACFTHNLNLEGATKVILDAAFGLTSRERFHTFVVSPFDGPARPRLESQGIECHILRLPGTESLITGWRRAADYEQSVRIVREFLAAEKPDAVMAMVLNSFYVIEACAGLGIPSLWLIQESYPHATMLRSINPFALPNLQRAFSLAHAVVYGSRGTREFYERYNTQQNFHVIFNALRPDELEMLRNGPSAAEARRRLGIPDRARVILSVGTVCKRKDQATLARALGLLAQRRDDFHAYLVGAREGDPYVRVVEQLIRNSPARGHVEVIRETHDVHAYYRAADIFAFSSLSESYPLVILEAMAHGLPIVTTNCTGVSEQVQFGSNALSFQFTDAEGLANHLDALLSNDEQRRHMAQRSLEIFASMLTYNEMIDEYEALLQSALQPCRSTAEASTAARA